MSQNQNIDTRILEALDSAVPKSATIAVHVAEPLPGAGSFARIKKLVFQKGRLQSEETVHEKAGLLLG